MTSPLMNTIRSRRSIRHFTDAPVSAEEINIALEAGRWAPSGLNNQPWRFLVVRGDDPRRATLAGLTKYARIVNEAAALIAVFLAKEDSYNRTKDCQGVGACIQNMLLAVHDLGLGAVWLGEIINQEPRVTEALGLSSEKYELMVVVAMGRPDGEGKSSRKELAELLIEPFEGS